jgi:hypothetical protein
MATNYIEREAVLQILSGRNAPWYGYNAVKILPAADVVSKAAYDQVAWERHLAEVQLKSIGKSLGEKMDDVHYIVRCKDCRHRDPEDHKCDSGQLERAGCLFPVDDDYFCAYGERNG